MRGREGEKGEDNSTISQMSWEAEEKEVLEGEGKVHSGLMMKSLSNRIHHAHSNEGRWQVGHGLKVNINRKDKARDRGREGVGNTLLKVTPKCSTSRLEGRWLMLWSKRKPNLR